MIAKLTDPRKYPDTTRAARETRSRRAAVDQLVSFAAGFASIDELGVEDTVCGEEADRLVDRLGELYPKERILRSGMTPVIGSHTGPGLLVVSVLGDRKGD
jgi:fatty acid-binding protein DegV